MLGSQDLIPMSEAPAFPDWYKKRTSCHIQDMVHRSYQDIYELAKWLYD